VILPARIQCGIFKHPQGARVIIGGTLSRGEIAEVQSAFQQRGRIVAVALPSGPVAERKGAIWAGGLIIAISLLATGVWLVWPARVPFRLVTKEQSLGRIGPMTRTKSFCSPDLRHVTFIVERGRKELVVVDGVEGKEYDKVKDPPIFCPDSKRGAYVAERGRKSLVVVDGVEGKQYDDILFPIFSPDSKRVAYVAKRGGKSLVVVDGVEGKEYDEIGGPDFSPDSKHLAYVAARGPKQFVVVDGVEGQEYSRHMTGRLVFDSPDALRTLAIRGKEMLRVEIRIVEK